MSNKTIFKRIALVAVSALGAGLLTVTPATATDNAAVGENNAAEAEGLLNIATKATVTGDAITSTTYGNNRSRGLLANSTTLGVSSLSSTATMRADGEIVFYTILPDNLTSTDATDDYGVVTVEGGYISDASATLTLNTDSEYDQGKNTLVIGKDDTDGAKLAFAITPNSGSTQIIVSYYIGSLTAAQDTAGSMATVRASVLAGTTSKGTLTQRYTVTVVAASAGGTYSSAYSFVQGVATAKAATSNVDETNSLTITNAASSVAYIAMKLQDAYDVTLDNVGAVSITGTGGAGICYDGSSAACSPTNTTAVTNDASGLITVARPSALANKAFTTTVTITYNGAVVGTKTVKFLGEVAKMNVVQYKPIARVGATSTYQGQIEYLDNAGNVLVGFTSGTSAKSSSLNGFVTGVSVGDWADAADPVSYYDVTCGGTAGTNGGVSAGSADVIFRHTNPFSGSIIESAPVKITCAGDAVTYTASLDKASYAPGEIATLTITGKDSAGNLANTEVNFQSTTAGKEFAITAPQLTPVTAVSTSAVYFSSGAGVKTYKFTVGNTEGSYNMIVAIPVINAYLLGGANQTVAYKIAAPATGAVTNAEVLAAIVKLIASINKQIRALQKSLRR